MPPGTFITFEGIEGTGKSTQIGRLTDRLRETGMSVLATREPGGTELGRALRDLLLRVDAPAVDPSTELLLYVADRAQHLAQVIVPALERGGTVLCDRYEDATLAYQGYARGLGAERVRELHLSAGLTTRPHRTLLLDLDPERAMARVARRPGAPDRLESEKIDFHRRVREGYLGLAQDEPGRIRIVDASGNEQQVASLIETALADLFPALECMP